MTTHNHPNEAEELMAYLDGELAPEQATATAVHLENCLECQQLAADLRGLSQTLNTWELEAANSTMPASLADVLKKRLAETKSAPTIRAPWYLSPRFRGLVPAMAGSAFIAIVIAGMMLFRLSRPAFREVGEATQGPEAYLDVPAPASSGAGLIGGRVDSPKDKNRARGATEQGYHQWLARREGGSGGGMAPSLSAELQQPPSAEFRLQNDNDVPATTPMIIRTAALAVTTKDFDKARAQVEDILKHHRGYIGSLNITAHPGAGRTLSASLRVPSPQLDATIIELKALGRLDSESQNGEDVTSQYVDLNARLDNSRHTEQRLTDLLQNRTGKLSDVLSVENELARVRGEIESMEAERKTMANQVDFATLNLTLNEDYRAQLQVVPPSTSTRLINAAVEGYRNLTDGLMSVALFFLTSGPSLLLWAAILFIPTRFAWKRLRRGFVQ